MTREELLGFLRQHRVAVVGTVSPDGEPQSALVGIAVTKELEIVFDTLSTTRKCQNLRKCPKISAVVGWDQEITVQYEGVADEPSGAELEGLKESYFAVYADGRDRQTWEGITYFRIKPTWIRYSDFNSNGKIVEFSPSALKA
ncbi:MAG: pyridoxamine 5'-phosphate oxidase family protein [Steroidobacteraceae bacterium]